MAAIIASQPISTFASTVIVSGDISTVPSCLKALEPMLLDIFKQKTLNQGLEVFKNLRTITITHKLENGVFCLLDLAAPGGEKNVRARRIPQADVEVLTNLKSSDKVEITARLTLIVDQWLKVHSSIYAPPSPDYASFSYRINISILRTMVTSRTPSGQMVAFAPYKLSVTGYWKTKEEINHPGLKLELEKIRDGILKSKREVAHLDFQKVLDIFHANEVGTLLEVPNTPAILLESPIPQEEFLQSLTPVTLIDQTNIIELIELLGKEKLMQMIESVDSKTPTVPTILPTNKE